MRYCGIAFGLLCIVLGVAGLADARDIFDPENCTAEIQDPHVFTVAPCGADEMPVVDIWIFDLAGRPVEVIAADIWLASDDFQFCGTIHADSSTFAPEPGHTTMSGVHGWYLYPDADCATATALAIVVGSAFAALEFPVNGPDLNGDGAVTVTDFSLFGQRWQTSDICADFDENGVVALGDFAIFSSWFNHCSCD